MPSSHDFAQRLLAEAYRTLGPQVRGLEQEFQSFSSSLSAYLDEISRKLESLRNVELPTTEVILAEIFKEIIQQKDQETGSMALFARQVRQKETQEEILTLLLDAAHKFAPYVALFAVRGDQLTGWSSRGYAEDIAQKISSCSFPRSEDRKFHEAFEANSPIIDTDLPTEKCDLQFLQSETDGPWHLFPMRVMQHPVALVLAAGTSQTPCLPDAISILMDLTALSIENIAFKILNELTSARSQAIPQPSSSIQPAELLGSALRDKPLAAPSISNLGPANDETNQAMPVSDAGIEGNDRVESVHAEPTLEAEQSLEESYADSLAVPFKHELEPTDEGATADAEALSNRIDGPMPVKAEEDRPTISTPDSSTTAERQDTQAKSDQEKLHADAKRYARLLVSEIKLYNEQHVIEGRENHDLYIRLKSDIDRSREMYEKQVPSSISQKIDYFHDEIIRILGDNDPSALGSDYPGPRVES